MGVRTVARIAMVSEREARGHLRDLYAEIKAGMGTPNVPTLFRVMSQSSALLEANWRLYQTMMLADSQLPRATKEMIAVVVSKANSCNYCVTAHSIFLKGLGHSNQQIKDCTERIEAADLAPSIRALLDFAEKVTLDAGHIQDEDVQVLTALGFSEGQVLEAASVVGFFNGINRLVAALDVEPDLMMKVGVRLPPPLVRRVVKTSNREGAKSG